MSTRGSCAYERQNPFWSFQRCFGLTQALDDPALEARFAVLRSEYDEAPGADRLAEARHALSARNLSRGSQAWLDAQAAVDRVREVNAFREERLRRLRELVAGAPHASPGDRFKMRQAISSWSSFLRAQDANLRQLVESLARIGN